ncbi:putative glycoside hydrolase [Virgisporangium aurantiacum]|uniref:Uncharacterized protein n=1 Tax=Virgisporangium aurantiacum TaxID=175570 RepID=A0A8J3Z7N3_9ACTN|nr:putative glycoside hydrolase [Virgisporangium aurantiacum]GIJ58889.1 hypothetical protein Vau01_064050 [Virgisporangium aurantiacum]
MTEQTATRRRFAAWIRYGGPVSSDQVKFAIEHYQVAILQPWERDVLTELKRARPDMKVLAYKCLSSSRSYEPGPTYSSGVSHSEAERRGEHFFAHRHADNSRIEWKGYPGHWQMAVWSDEYRSAWIENVHREMSGSAWDGVMADNDVFDDYYGIDYPIEGGRRIEQIRAALDTLVQDAGSALNSINKLLVPNIAESRRETGRWARHAAYGGGFEEVWLAHSPDHHFDVATTEAQMVCLEGPGLSIVRTATDGTDGHPNFMFGLAAFWIFGGGRPGTSFSATGHDQYSGTPFNPYQDWDLGEPTGKIRRRGPGRMRAFSNGWAALNQDHRILGKEITIHVPPGLIGAHGSAPPRVLTLRPREGRLYLRSPDAG